MTYDGPTARTDTLLDDVRYELMVLNEQIRTLLNLEQRELPAPVVNVAPTPITLPEFHQPASADLTPLLGALQALQRDDSPVVDALSEVKKQLSDLGGAMRAIGQGSSYVGGAGPTHVSAEVYTPAGRTVSVEDAAKDTRYEWQSVAGSSAPLYIATAPTSSDTADGVWSVQKYTYSGADLSLVQTRTGSWDSRASLFS